MDHYYVDSFKQNLFGRQVDNFIHVGWRKPSSRLQQQQSLLYSYFLKKSYKIERN